MNFADRNDLIATMRNLRVCVLIPTYNNAGTLAHVISDVLNYAADVIVVNDGATDDTPQILEVFKDRVCIVTHKRNRGKGGALKTGFAKALELGYEYAVTIDSDGQHYASDIPAFVRGIAENPGTLIVGERDLTRVDINAKSSFANKFSNFWFNLQTGCRLNDTQTGYRAYPLKRLYGLRFLTSRYEAELELMVFASWHGVPIKSIPIGVYYPPQSERVSHFRPGLDFTRISILNTILCAGTVLYSWPVRGWSLLADKKLFGKEFKMFTHRSGERREAALTLDRLARSSYGIISFVFLTLGVFTPLGYLLTLVGKNSEKKRLRLHRSLQQMSKFLIKRYPGSKTRVEGDNVAEKFAKPVMVICNHQSHLDLPLLMSLHPKLVFLTNDWVWNNPFYGKIIRYAEYLPVSAGFDELVPKLRNLTQRGYSIVVFPEGTRSADCSILRFRQGAFLLAQELGLDILPMVLHGAGHYLPKKDFMLRRADMSLRVLERVGREQFVDMLLRQQGSYFRKLIRREYDAVAANKEKTDYYKPLALYKYAYRGWGVVARCKCTLAKSGSYADIIDNGVGLRSVRIINSGIGTFAFLYAMVNKGTEVYAFESSQADYDIASSMAGLPANLHFIHAVWLSDFNPEGINPDLTIVLNGRNWEADEGSATIYLDVKS